MQEVESVEEVNDVVADETVPKAGKATPAKGTNKGNAETPKSSAKKKTPKSSTKKGGKQNEKENEEPAENEEEHVDTLFGKNPL